MIAVGNAALWTTLRFVFQGTGTVTDTHNNLLIEDGEALTEDGGDGSSIALED